MKKKIKKQFKKKIQKKKLPNKIKIFDFGKMKKSEKNNAGKRAFF